MFQKLRVAVVRSTRPVYLAALSSSLFFAAGIHRVEAHAGVLARHAVYTGIFFLCMWVACRLFAAGLNRRLALEGVSTDTASDLIYTFVIYLEIIKHVIGVSFTLGWIAGVMFCWDYLGDRMVMIPVGASLTVSLVAFLVTFGAATFIDNLHWPETEDE